MAGKKIVRSTKYLPVGAATSPGGSLKAKAKPNKVIFADYEANHNGVCHHQIKRLPETVSRRGVQNHRQC